MAGPSQGLPSQEENAVEGTENCEEGVPDDDEEANVNISESDKEVTYYFEEDDEAEELLRSISLGEAQSTGSQSLIKKARPVVICEICGRKYMSIENVVKHKITHAMTDCYKKAPPEEILHEKFKSFLPIVMSEIEEMAASYNVGYSDNLVTFVKNLKSVESREEWCNFLNSAMIGLTSFFNSTSTFLTPSDLRMAFTKNYNYFIADKAKQCELVALLLSMVDGNPVICNLFYGFFLRKLSFHLLAFYVHYMLKDGGNSESVAAVTGSFYVSKQPTDCLDYKQVIHYVGGANVRSLLRTAFRIKNRTCEWQRVLDAIKNYFLISELAAAPDAELMQWTEDQDRGGLLKINAKLHRFLVELGIAVNALEHLDGSLFVEEVMAKITSSGKLIRMWDDTLQGSLPQDEAFKLLHALCSHFCSTWRSGIISRRLDQLSAIGESVGGAKHGQSGVAFRTIIG